MIARYIFKLWFSVLLSTPVLFWIYLALSTASFWFDMEFFLYFLAYEFALSVPTLFALMILTFFVEGRIKKPLRLKVFYILTTLAGMGITMLIFFGIDGFGNVDYAGWIFTLMYAMSITGFGFLYKLHSGQEELKKEEVS